MPIRASQRKLYPPRKEWRALRAQIMERAGNRCECTGECGACVDARCRAPHGALIIRDESEPSRYTVHEPCGGCAGGDPDCARAVRVVLTIAHLDHNPTRNDPSNLRAWCQRCHLLYDKYEHAKNARATRFARKAVGTLPGVE